MPKYEADDYSFILARIRELEAERVEIERLKGLEEKREAELQAAHEPEQADGFMYYDGLDPA